LRNEAQEGFGVPKYDSCAGFGYAMLRNGRFEAMADRGGIDDETLPSVALVPLARPIRPAPTNRITRPDPSFVAHLIATAAHVPQTRNLRRAAPSDAHSAYTASLRPVSGAGCRTRQVV
jgi:hypothetical protein